MYKYIFGKGSGLWHELQGEYFPLPDCTSRGQAARRPVGSAAFAVRQGTPQGQRLDGLVRQVEQHQSKRNDLVN